MIRLSIAIPTYNGAETLGTTLDSLVGQLHDEVEIIVVDNASTDATPQVVSSYQQRHPQIRYHRNADNIGADGNFNMAVECAAGEFVWLLSDDDLLADGAIRHVLDVLQAHPDLGAVFVNWSPWDSTLSHQAGPAVLDIQADTFCRDHNEFLNTARLNPLLVSANIVRRQLWLQARPSRFIGSNWIHYAAMLSFMPGHAGFCIAAPLVRFRAGLLGWKVNFEARLRNTLNLYKLLETLLKPHYTPHLMRQLVNISLQDIATILAGCKLQGLRRRTLWKMTRPLRPYPQFWLKGMPVLLTPRPVLRLLRPQAALLRAWARKWRKRKKMPV